MKFLNNFFENSFVNDLLIIISTKLIDNNPIEKNGFFCTEFEVFLSNSNYVIQKPNYLKQLFEHPNIRFGIKSNRK